MMASMAMACTSPERGMTVMAHRGASGLAPESSLFAYQEALKLPVDYLEGDVQRTKDGILVLFHDGHLGSDTDVELVYPDRIEEPIETFTWEELAKLSSGKWFNRKHKDLAQTRFDQARILPLEELLKTLDPQKGPGLYLETKRASAHPGVEQQTVALLRKYGWLPLSPNATQPRVLIQSFEKDSLERLRVLEPSLPRVLLVAPMEVASLGADGVLSYAKALNAYGVGVHSISCTPWNLGAWQNAGLKVHAYTLNNPWQFFVMKRLGVDGIFTDRPDRLVDYLERKSP